MTVLLCVSSQACDRPQSYRRQGSIALIALLLSLSAALAAQATGPHIGELETVAAFDPSRLETPEGLVVDRHGNIFVTSAFTGEIFRVTPEGDRTTFAQLPLGVPGAPCTDGGFPAVMGAIAQGPFGYFFVTLNPCDPVGKGVWVVSPEGETGLLAQLHADTLLNGITQVGPWLFVADSAGALWRVPLWGGEATLASDHAWLQPIPEVMGPGPNGIQYFRGALYVSNSDTAQILRFPLTWHGTVGSPTVHADLPSGCDDFAFDVRGRIYCTTDPFNTVLRVSADGQTIEVLLTADDGLDGPTAAAFGRRGGGRFDLYITNAAFPFFTTEFTPSLQRLRVDAPGAYR